MNHYTNSGERRPETTYQHRMLLLNDFIESLYEDVKKVKKMVLILVSDSRDTLRGMEMN